MMKQLIFYERQLSIDKEDLDNEVANFPSLFYTVTDHYLDALKNSKRLQSRVDRKFAELASAIRSSAHASEQKITEAQIKQEVLIHPTYRKLKAKHSDAVYIQDRWAALKEAFVQKSFSLKGLVSLAIHEQYQSDSAKGGKRK